MIAVLPSLLLLIGAVVLWASRRRSDRATWALAVLFALVAWLAVLGLLLSIPADIELSAWRPETLFRAHLAIVVDRAAWGVLYAAATAVLAVFLTAAARPAAGAGVTRAMMLGYSSAALLAIQAGNLLTVVVLWTVLDLAAFVFLIARVEDVTSAQRVVGRLGVDMAGTLLAVLAAAASFSAGQDATLEASVKSPLPAILLVLAILLRLGLVPLHFAASPLAHIRRGFGTLLRLLPPAAALAVLARAFSAGVPPTMAAALIAVGAIGALVGSLRWFAESDVLQARPYLVMALGGLGVLAAGQTPDQAPLLVGVSGAMVISLGAVASLAEIHNPWHRGWPVVACILSMGLPWTLGGKLMQGLVATANAWSIAASVAAVISLSLVLAGMVRLARRGAEPWPSGETLIRTLYGLGLALPVLSLAGLGWMVYAAPDLPALAGLAGVVLLLALAWSRRGRLTGRAMARVGRWAAWLDPQPLYAAGWAAYRRLMDAVRSLLDVLEGEGAFLWVFVVLLMIAVALQEAPR